MATPPRSALALLALLVALALVGCGGGGTSTPASTSASTSAPDHADAAACNGLRSLCSRRLSEVVFPGTHNSYSAADQPGWRFASQPHGIARQLDDGIRALLIDVHYGVAEPGSDLVRTDLAAEGADRNKVAAVLPKPALRAAEQIGGRLGVGLPPGSPGLYLCHTLCELGAEPLSAELAVIRDFLRSHRRETLILIVEDYVPPAAIAKAFDAAGLSPYVAELQRSEPLPTLGRLVAEDHRLVVFAEKEGGSPPWYMPAFSFIEDTPLGAKRPDQLSCARFRGEADSPLLLVNHWIPPFPPSPRLNAVIGRDRFLRHRVEDCMAARHRAGAIVAVDSYDRTAVVRVARQLNR